MAQTTARHRERRVVATSRHPRASKSGSGVVVNGDPVGYLLAYFTSEAAENGEQVSFAVSTAADPISFTPVAGGKPVLESNIGEGGVRDPFLVRDGGRILLIGTDLRIGHGGDWAGSVRNGSRSIITWESRDLINWSEPWLSEIAPPEAGNAWAPKAYWSQERSTWLVYFASALYSGPERGRGEYQRIMVASTPDFRTYEDAEIYLDRGHDVIDSAFLQVGGEWHRFSVDAEPVIGGADVRGFVYQECGQSLDDPSYRPVRAGLGRPDLAHGEGPAVTSALNGAGAWLLIDEFGLRGYRLFHAKDPASGEWTPVPDAVLPAGARHGSLLPITAEERDRLLRAPTTSAEGQSRISARPH